MTIGRTDYDPLRRSNANRGAARAAKSTGDKIDSTREGLELQEKGIALKTDAVRRQQAWNTFSLVTGLGDLALDTVSVVQDYQTQQADNAVNRLAGEYQTRLLEMQASGELTVGEDGKLSGLDGLNDFQLRQMAEIDGQKWFGSVKKSAKAALEGLYGSRQQAIYQGILQDTIRKNDELQMMNLSACIDNDASRVSYTKEDAYAMTDSHIDGMPNLTEVNKTILKASSHADIDLKRAQNSVRVAAQNGGYSEGVSEADHWADSKHYDEKTRESLYDIAGRISRTAQADLTSRGRNDMASGLRDGEMPADIWARIEDVTRGMPEENRQAYVEGAERAQADYAARLYAEAAQEDPELMTEEQKKRKLEQLKGIRGLFDGTEATKKLYDKLEVRYSGKKAAEYTASEYVRLQDALLDYLIPAFEKGDITADTVIDTVEGVFGDVKEKEGWIGAENAMRITTTGNKIINSLASKIKGGDRFRDSFDSLNRLVESDVASWGKQKDARKLTPEQQERLYRNQIWAQKSLMSAIGRSPGMTDQQLADTVGRIRAAYIGDNYETLKKEIVVTVSKTAKEGAMEKTMQFQSLPEEAFGYVDAKTKKLVVNPEYRDAYDGAMRTERDMLRDNYGIDVKDKYAPMVYDGKIVPVFEDRDGARYTVMDMKVYRLYENAIKEIQIKKPIEQEGYEAIPGVSRTLLGDPNAGKPISSGASKDNLFNHMR